MNIALFPMLCSLVAGILCVFFHRQRWIQRVITIVAALITTVLGVELIARTSQGSLVVSQLGNWAAPYGITYVVDLFSAIMIFISGILATLVSIFAFSALPQEFEKRFFYPLWHFLLVGVLGAFSTGDIFNLYVCFELLLLSSFVLLVMGNRPEQIRAAFKYVVLNFLGSIFFLLGIAMLYSEVGTLNMAQLASRVGTLESLPTSLALARSFLFLAFATKAGLFPLFFWLPASYHTPHPVVSTFFSGLLTKVGVYSLFRVFSLIFPQSDWGGLPMILQISLLTMVIGVIGAVSMGTIRKILSVHIISQIGYMTLALSLMNPLAVGAGIFYLLSNILAKTNLFLIGAAIHGSQNHEVLKDSGGWMKKNAFLALFFFISALGLAGIPPFNGFFAKLYLVKALFQESYYVSGAIALLVGVLTLFSMSKIWNEVFLKSDPSVSKPGVQKIPFFQLLPIFSFTALIVLMGLYAGPIGDYCIQAAQILMNRQNYFMAVFPGGTF